MTDKELNLYLNSHLSKDDYYNLMYVFFNKDHEDIAGVTRSDKFREFVLWCKRHSKLSDLDKVISTIMFLCKHFNISEMEDIAFDLNIKLDSVVGGDTKPSIALKIMSVLQIERRYEDLTGWMIRNRRDMII